jgi:hypothetical protein
MKTTTLSLVLSTLLLAWAAPAEAREQSCTTEIIDSSPVGDSPTKVSRILRVVLTHEKLDRALLRRALGSPDRQLVAGKFLRVSWVSGTSRMSKRIYCDGTTDSSTMWSFFIVESEWVGGKQTRCTVFHKLVVSENGDVDPFAVDSPIGDWAECRSVDFESRPGDIRFPRKRSR